MWVFGYGSLLWKPNFEYEDQIIGYVRGYKRRFWQLNTDHRGVPGKPGRVATLVQDAEHLVWGVAYKVAQEKIEEVRSNLDFREREGYSTANLTFHPREDNHQAFTIMLYIGTPENPQYGPADEMEIAQVINKSIGPSGRNTEYLFRLAEYVREHIPEDNDNHLFQLERLVKQACS